MDLHPRRLVDPITNTVWDWMHTFAASSGVCQYEVQAFSSRLVDNGGSLETLDKYAARFTWPAPGRKLPSRYFRDRVGSGHQFCKGFAAETITAVLVLSQLVATAWEDVGAGPMARECESMRLLHSIIDILRDHAGAQRVDTLEAALQAHHDAFLDCYGAELSKQKMHYAFHLPKCIRDHNGIFSCFAMERKHKDAKSIVAHNGRRPAETALVRSLLHQRAHIQIDIVPETLGKNTATPEVKASLQAVFGPGLGAPSSSKQFKGERGKFTAGDVIVVRVRGVLRVARAMFFSGARDLSTHTMKHAVFCRLDGRNIRLGPILDRLGLGRLGRPWGRLGTRLRPVAPAGPSCAPGCTRGRAQRRGSPLTPC